MFSSNVISLRSTRNSGLLQSNICSIWAEYFRGPSTYAHGHTHTHTHTHTHICWAWLNGTWQRSHSTNCHHSERSNRNSNTAYISHNNRSRGGERTREVCVYVCLCVCVSVCVSQKGRDASCLIFQNKDYFKLMHPLLCFLFEVKTDIDFLHVCARMAQISCKIGFGDLTGSDVYLSAPASAAQ